MSPDEQERYNIITNLWDNYNKARVKHKPMNNAHEGYAVILEELDEMWDEIKKDNKINAKKECYQVAAMCLAFILEIK